MTPDLYG